MTLDYDLSLSLRIISSYLFVCDTVFLLPTEYVCMYPLVMTPTR